MYIFTTESRFYQRRNTGMNNYLGIATAGGGFNPFSAGNKSYGGGRPMPTIGPVDPLGYRDRDAKTQAKRTAMLRQIQALQQGNTMSSSYLGGPNPWQR
jgi:hypothetical protein